MIKFESMFLDENKKNQQTRDKFSTVAFKFKYDSTRGVLEVLINEPPRSKEACSLHSS